MWHKDNVIALIFDYISTRPLLMHKNKISKIHQCRFFNTKAVGKALICFFYKIETCTKREYQKKIMIEYLAIVACLPSGFYLCITREKVFFMHLKHSLTSRPCQTKMIMFSWFHRLHQVYKIACLE
jgi:hypothetical protein